MSNAEKSWMDAICRMGCCVCIRLGHGPTPAEVHHILSGGRRKGHMASIPLCSPGHHRNGEGVKKISRHPWKARFEAEYGSEEMLLEWTRKYLQVRDAAR